MLDRSSALAHPQVVVTLGVVAAFLTATVVTALHAAAVGRDADAIVGNALPSVQYLSEARGAMHRLDSAADQWVDVAREGGVPRLESLAGYVDDVEATLLRYQALPAFPDEREKFGAVRARVTATQIQARRVADALRARDEQGAEEALSEEQRAAALCDAELEGLIAFNVAWADRMGRDIGVVRRSTRRIAFSLDALAVALAVIATALSVATVRRGMTALQQARALAERRSAELDGFAGKIAHDILSPLNTVHLGLSIIEPRVRGDEAAETAVRRASRSVLRVKSLVDGLLGYARAAARPDPEATAPVSAVIHDVVDGLRRDAQDHGVELELQETERASVASSVGVLTSVVSNLVQNAIKYMGDRPRRVVTVRTTTTDQRVRVEVEDTGPGVPPEMVDSIFEPFVRGVVERDGIGLGLATVRQLVRAHGGALGVRSAPGEGSLFWFELPRARQPDAHAG